MTAARLTPATIAQVAARFGALAVPSRLRLMNAMRTGERSVGDLVAASGLGIANASKHLQVLHGAGFLVRRKQGLHVYYALAGRDVLQLCDIMCGRLAAEKRAGRRAGPRQRSGRSPGGAPDVAAAAKRGSALGREDSNLQLPG